MNPSTARNLRVIFFACVASCVCSTAAFPEVLKKEPPYGQLKPGQRVFVDDGKCPKGQIMEVTGGDHIKAGGSKQIERSRRCIPR